MPRFAANLTMLFNEVPFLERFELAARAGFDAVELLFPYGWPADEIRARLDQHDLSLVLHDLPAGDWDAGERGIACHPDRIEEFRDGVDEAIDYACALGVPRLNCLAGRMPEGVAIDVLRSTLVDNLRYAARRLARHDLTLLIEPINRYDIPGFYLHRTDQAMSILDDVGAENALLQYDLYHAQRTEGELSETLRTRLRRIGHVQVADNPGRHEPGTGEIRFSHLFGLLDRLDYDGWIGCEYRPRTTTEAGLGWRQRLAG